MLRRHNSRSGRLDAARRSARRLLVTANVVPGSPILVTLMMEAIRSSEPRATWCKIPEDGIFHSRRHKNFQSYIRRLLRENSAEHTNTLRGQNVEFLFGKAGGMYCNQWILKVEMTNLLACLFCAHH
jgi:hypothetical protein